MVLVLVGVALICGGLLAYVNQMTEPAIKAQAEKALADGIKAVLDAENVNVKETKNLKENINGKDLDFVVYVTDQGTAVRSTDPNGFGGTLTVLVGFDAEGTIKGYTVLQQAEAPGVGAIAPEWFQTGRPGCCVGLNPKDVNLTVSKDGGDIDAITASTITSRSFLRAVQQAYDIYAKNGADSTTGATQHAK